MDIILPSYRVGEDLNETRLIHPRFQLNLQSNELPTTPIDPVRRLFASTYAPLSPLGEIVQLWKVGVLPHAPKYNAEGELGDHADDCPANCRLAKLSGPFSGDETLMWGNNRASTVPLATKFASALVGLTFQNYPTELEI